MNITTEVLHKFREALCRALDNESDHGSHDELVALMGDFPELADEFVLFMQSEACLEEIYSREYSVRQSASTGNSEQTTNELSMGLNLLARPEFESKAGLLIDAIEVGLTAPASIRMEEMVTPVSSDKHRSPVTNQSRAAHGLPSENTTKAWFEALSFGKPYHRNWRFSRVHSLAALAAALLLATGFYWYLPRSFSTLTASDQPVWQNGTRLVIGSEISNHWYELISGSLSITCHSDAELLIQGPARFRIDGAKHCELAYGTLTANVPAHAIGFTVKTLDMRIVDLGTGFRVTASPSVGSQVQVLEGLVRIDSEDGTRKLLAGDFAEAGPKSQGLLKVMPLSELVPSTSPWIVYRSEHPKSLEYGGFRGDDRAYLYLEGKNLVPSEEVKLNCIHTGVHSSFAKVEGKLPRQMPVDCYLLHSAPYKSSHTLEGTITFAREIVGVIATSQDLNDTNRLLGLPWTLQCHHIHRGLEPPENTMADQITISPDRRTLSVSLKTTSIDQLRVLVQSSRVP